MRTENMTTRQLVDLIDHAKMREARAQRAGNLSGARKHAAEAREYGDRLAHLLTQPLPGSEAWPVQAGEIL